MPEKLRDRMGQKADDYGEGAWKDGEDNRVRKITSGIDYSHGAEWMFEELSDLVEALEIAMTDLKKMEDLECDECGLTCATKAEETLDKIKQVLEKYE